MENQFVAVFDNDGAITVRDGAILCKNVVDSSTAFVKLNQETCRTLGLPESLATGLDGYEKEEIENYDSALPSTSQASRATPSVLSAEQNSLDCTPPKLKWTSEATRTLIEVYKGKHFLFDTRLKNERVWQIMCDEMAKGGLRFNLTQLRNRFASLKRLYTKKKDGMKITGIAPARFDYWENFEEIFAKDHNVTSLCTSSNLRPITLSESQSELEEHEEASTPNKVVRKSLKPPAESSLVEEIKLLRKERKEKWEEKKELIKQQMEEKRLMSAKHLEEARESRKTFEKLMEKLE